MNAITASIRLQVTSREEAEQVRTWLQEVLGAAVALTAPHRGRGEGVWFVRGTLTVTEGALVEALVRTTGEIVFVPQPGAAVEEAPDDQARRLARLSGLNRPELRPDDGIDRHKEHERLRRLKDEEQES